MNRRAKISMKLKSRDPELMTQLEILNNLISRCDDIIARGKEIAGNISMNTEFEKFEDMERTVNDE